ncbi:MAG: peptidoglycan bridge formation glycyltransferase FemA/FemB family protein [Chloroflexota bacterium]|nr:peptidoglycan bridge formation glycyltransferase FemA/FemB family protein [Chloroflexota bacterium]
MEFFEVKGSQGWNETIKNLPGAHALQTWQWGQVKSRFGWQPHHLLWRNENGEVVASVLVLQRRIDLAGLPIGMSVMYAPRGPLLDWSDAALVKKVLDDLQRFAEQKKVIFLKIDPDLPIGYGIPGDEKDELNPIGEAVKQSLKARDWVFSEEQIQFKNTVVVDLKGDQDEMLMRMKSKTRYNIRLAERRGVRVRPGGIEDIDLLYSMYAHTAVRDDFLIRGKEYYRAVWEHFFADGLAEPLIAEVAGSPVGAVVIFRFGGRAWYIHGMSLNEHREKMFNYRLQWEAMLYSKRAGCYQYDMWGAPDTFDESDPLWGVYRFKDGFGGLVHRTLGAWDYPVRSISYPLYTRTLPRILGWMRQRGKKDTKRSLSA